MALPSRGRGWPFGSGLARARPKRGKGRTRLQRGGWEGSFVIVIPVNIDKYALPALGKGIGLSFSWVVWPFLLFGRGWTSFSLLGLEVGVGPYSLGLMLSSFVWL